jgi:signal transduction histidine kinase
MKSINSFLQRLPFTLLTLAGLIIAGLVTNTYFQEISKHLLNRTGFAPNDLWYWRLERMFTSAFVTSGGIIFWEALFFVVFTVGLAEWMTGWKRTAATFWGVHLLALILLSLILSLAAHHLRTIGLEASELARDVGPSAGYFGCLGLVSARLKHPWNWVSGSILLIVFATMLFTPAAIGESAKLKFSADLAHLLAFPLGWLFGRIDVSTNPFLSAFAQHGE